MVLRLLLVTIPLATFLLQTNLVLQLLYFYRIPVGRKNRQKDDQTCSAGCKEVKIPLSCGLEESEARESSKHLHILNTPTFSELKHCYRSPFFSVQKGGSVCKTEVNKTFTA